MPSSPTDIVGVGLNATDTLIRLPHFPALDSKTRLLSSSLSPGGQIASALVAARRWGLTTRYIGSVGDDSAAEFQRDEFSREGVETHLHSVPDCPSQFAYILIDELSGERTILWQRDDRLALPASFLRREWITSARALHVDGHDAATNAVAARWAREARIPVTADIDNLYPGVEALLPNVDYLLASREFPARLTAEPDPLVSLPAIASRFGCRVAGITLGRSGVLAYSPYLPPPGFLYTPGFDVRAVDTTGAGDIFHAAFLYALLQSWPLDRSLDFSCAAAALNCTAPGARGGIKPIPEIESFRLSAPRTPPAFSPAYISSRPSSS